MAAALLAAGCSRSAPETPVQREADAPVPKAAEPWFEEVSERAGVDFRFETGHQEGRFYMPEVKGGGVAVFDYDNDGLLDIFCVQAGALDPAITIRPGHKLFHNLGNWKFEDVTERAGVRGQGAYGVGCACADYDGDGWGDLYVTAWGTNALFRNNGDGTFTDVARAAGVDHVGWGASAAFFDYDRDGHLDLVVANYIRWSREAEVPCYSRGGLRDYCSPLNYRAPAMDTLYRNRGDGTFEDVSVAAGLDKAYGYGLGVVGFDFNGDGLLDIFVANDATPNQLWINRGNGTFSDEAMLRGCGVNSMGTPEAGMGIGVVDAFERGQFDLFVTHLTGEANRLWMNTNGYFTDVVMPKGPGATSWSYTSFGTGFADFDNDGILDLFVANGRVKHGPTDLDPNDPYAEPNNLLRGLGRGEFEEVFPQGGTAPPLLAASRGCAFGDLDNDGGVDIVISNRDGPVHVLRNLVGARGHWVKFQVLDRSGRCAAGAVVRLEAGGKARWQPVLPNASYCSSNDPRLHFGLGALARADRITVKWLDGSVEEFGPFDGNRWVTLRQGAGRPANDWK